jgi:hypothetical protein
MYGQKDQAKTEDKDEEKKNDKKDVEEGEVVN